MIWLVPYSTFRSNFSFHLDFQTRSRCTIRRCSDEDADEGISFDVNVCSIRKAFTIVVDMRRSLLVVVYGNAVYLHPHLRVHNRGGFVPLWFGQLLSRNDLEER